MSILFDRIRYGKETNLNPYKNNELSYGKIIVDNNICNGCRICKDVCVVDAIVLINQKASIDYKKCIYCKNCIDICSKGALKNSHDFKMADLELAGNELKEKIYKKYKRSLTLRSVDTGSCNACLQELSALSNTYYALSRFGIDFTASPRHADGIVVTGPVSINMKEALLKTYNAMSEPRIVIGIGACANDGGIFKNSYANINELRNIIPIDLMVPGCPPSPSAIIYGLLKLLDRI